MSPTYARRKKKELARLRLVVLLACMLVAAWTWRAAGWWLGEEQLDKLLGVLKRGQSAGKAADALGLMDLVPLASVAGIAFGLVIAVWKVRSRVALFLYERWRDVYQHDLFKPIASPAHSPPPLPLKRALPWVALSAESTPARRALWHALEHWAREGADLRAAKGQAVVLSWAMVVGQPGAGKSRMAHEFARRLGRRALLGDKTGPEGRPWRHRLDAMWLRLASGVRRAWRRPAASDPWDVLMPRLREEKGSVEKLDRDHPWIRDLATWRPRCPTLIVFEDPRAGEAVELIKTLKARALPTGESQTEMPFKFPVRLLIVNQTLPADLRFVREPSNASGWGSELAHFRGGPWWVDEGCYLSFAEWDRLARHQLQGKAGVRAGALGQARFETITRDGHPLLVESLLDWLQRNDAHGSDWMDRITPAELLADRARRVLMALEAVGLTSHTQWCLLAAASLVGGLPVDKPMVRQWLQDAKLELRALWAAFPQTPDIQKTVPPVRPDLIGLSFIDLVIDTPVDAGLRAPALPATRQATAQAIARWACLADPAGVLAALHRIRDRAAQRDFGPPGELRRVLLAALEQALAEQVEPGDPAFARDLAHYHMVYGQSPAAVRRHIEALPPAWARLLVLEDVPRALQEPAAPEQQEAHAARQLPRVALRDALAVHSLALARWLAPAEGEPDAATAADADCAEAVRALTALAEQVQSRGRNRLTNAFDWVPRDGYALLGNALRGILAAERVSLILQLEVEQLLDALWRSDSLRLNAMSSLCKPMSTLTEDPRVRRLAWVAQACVVALTQVDELTSRVSERLRQLQDEAGVSADPAWAGTLALAWARIAYAHGGTERPTEARACAEAIARLAKPLRAQPEVERWTFAECQAEAWLFASYAHSELKEAPEARECAWAIARLAERFDVVSELARRVLAEVEAQAWAHAATAYSLLNQPTEARECARAIVRLAKPFEVLSKPERLRLVDQQAKAWRASAYAHGHMSQPIEARECVQVIARLAEPFEVLSEVERQTLAESLAAAWTSAAQAHSQMNQLVGVRECVQEIIRLGEPFERVPETERRTLVQWQAYTWVQVAFVHDRLREPAEAEACAQKIARLAEPFELLAEEERRVFSECLAWALAHAAHAYRQLSMADERLRCGQRLREVLAPWLDELPRPAWLANVLARAGEK